MFYATSTITLDEIKRIPGIGSALADVLSEVGIEEIEDFRENFYGDMSTERETR